MSDTYDIANVEQGVAVLSEDKEPLTPVNEVTSSITKLWKDQAAALQREDALEQVLTNKIIENVQNGEMSKDDVMALWINKHQADTDRISKMMTPYAGIVQEDIRSKTMQSNQKDSIGNQNNIQVNIKHGNGQDLGAALPGVDQSVLIGLDKLSAILNASANGD